MTAGIDIQAFSGMSPVIGCLMQSSQHRNRTQILVKQKMTSVLGSQFTSLTFRLGFVLGPMLAFRCGLDTAP